MRPANWRNRFLELAPREPGPGIHTVDSPLPACSFISPEAGVTPTPVIDPATRTMYALVRTFENLPGTQGH